MVPCFNAADTVRLALASVYAQTFEDWECLCVDDGSTDATWQALAQAASADPRFKVFRFDQNRGRGAARQFLLEQVSAPQLAFLDADDWMYPKRLEEQLQWLELDPALQAVSSPMSIFDEQDELIGEARARTKHGTPSIEVLTSPEPPKLFFPSSMLRSKLVKEAKFDVTLRRSQDSDMLIRALLGRRYALTSQPLYAYRRAAMTLEKTLEGYRYRRRAHRKHLKTHPVRVTRTLAETVAKELVYRALGAFGAHQRLLAARYGHASDAARRRYRAAREQVSAAHRSLWCA